MKFNKIFLLLLVMVVLVGTVFAGSVKYFDDTEGQYGKITLKDRQWFDLFGWFSEETIQEVQLERHTDVCFFDCSSEGTSVLYKKMPLFESISFKDRQGNDAIVDYQIYIKQDVTRDFVTTEYLPDNKSKLITNKITNREWVEYNFEELKADVYEWRIEGRKDPYKDVDWLVVANGEELIEYAWWDTIGGNFEVFTANGTFTVPTGVTNVSVLVVGGGAGGGKGLGNDGSGGGGGGALIFNSSYTVTPAAEIAVVVGTGGVGGSGGQDSGDNGTFSSFGFLTAIGGGGGSSWNIDGFHGGSGGGGGGDSVATDGGTSSIYGSNGGDGGAGGAGSRSGGGGGGNGSVGANGAGGNGGAGGSGGTYFGEEFACGGGGGGSVAGAAGCDGAGIGGTGSNPTAANSSFGHGGGGSGTNAAAGGAGGSGLVFVRYVGPPVPIVTLNFPIDTFNATNSTIVFSGNVSSVPVLANVSLIIDGKYNETNSTPVNATRHNFTKKITEGDRNWTMEGCNINGCANATTQFFNVNISLNVSLTHPDNNTQTNNNSVYFNGTIVNSGMGMVNTTFSMWHTNGTLFNRTTKAVSGIGPSDVFFNITNFVIGNYVWNIEGCMDQTGPICNVSFVNRTFEHVPFENVGEEFNPSSFETKDETFKLNVSITPIVSNIGSFLLYNGTLFPATGTCTSSLCQLETTIDISLLENQDNPYENKTFRWQITLFGDFGTFSSNLTIHQQNVSNINLTNAALSPAKTVTYNIFNESPIVATKANFQATFDYYLGAGTVSESKNFSLSEAISYDFYINHNQTFIINSTIRIVNETRERDFFFLKEERTNVTQIQELFLPVEGLSDIIIEVKDQGLIPLPGHIVKIFRFHPDLNQYKQVANQMTDEFGQVVEKLLENDAQYRFQFFDQNNVTLKISDKVTIACRTAFCVIPFIIETSADDFARFINLTDFDSQFSFNNVTNIFTFSWDDQRQEDSFIRLEVIRFELNASTLVCNDTSSTIVSSLTCSVGNQRASYRASVFRSVDNDETRIAIINVAVGEIFSIFGVEGLLWVFILLFITVGLGAFNPTAGAVLYGAGFIMFGTIGIISMPLPVFFANTLLVGLFIWGVNK